MNCIQAVEDEIILIQIRKWYYRQLFHASPEGNYWNDVELAL